MLRNKSLLKILFEAYSTKKWSIIKLFLFILLIQVQIYVTVLSLDNNGSINIHVLIFIGLTKAISI